MRKYYGRQLILFIFIPSMVIILLLLPMCGKTVETNRTELVTRLIATVNKHPDLEIKTNPGEAEVKQEKNGGYLITLKNVSIETNLANITHLTNVRMIMKDAPVYNILPPKFRKILLSYHPGKKYLAVKEVNGLSLKLTKSETSGFGKYSPGHGWLKCEAFTKRIIYNDADISQLLKPETKYLSLVARRTDKINLEKTGIKIDGFRINIDGGTGIQKMFSLIFKAKTFRAEDKSDSITSKIIDHYVFSKSNAQLNIEKIRNSGKSLSHETLAFSDLEFALYIKGRKQAHGTIGKLSITNFLKPCKYRKFFEFGFHFGLHDLKTTFPGNPKIEWLANIDECRYGVCFGHMNDECVRSLLKIMKRAMDNRGTANTGPGTPTLTILVFQMFDVLIKSNFELKFYIKPFKHKCGEGFFDYKIKIHDGNRAEASFSLGFKNPDGFIDGMESVGLFPPQFTIGLRQMFLLMGRKDDEGYKTITYHLNSDQLKTMLNYSAANSSMQIPETGGFIQRTR